MKTLRIKHIEKFLFSKFSKASAESWDRVGLLIGSRRAKVKGIACALNATSETIKAAARAGCNVLVTHHPAYLDKPSKAAIKSGDILEDGLEAATIAAAIDNGVAIISMHTNLDVSHEALRLAAKLSGFRFSKRLIKPKTSAFSRKENLRGSYGCILTTATKSAPVIARVFAKTYDTSVAILGKKRAKTPKRIAFCAGTLDAEIGAQALLENISMIVCGEVHYHDALSLCDAGATILCLGHDASEKPYAGLLENLLKHKFKGVKTILIEERNLLLGIK